MTPVELRGLVRELAFALRERVLPLLGAHAAREGADGAGGAVARGAGGDITFEIDAVAERALEAFLAEHAPGLAYYTEDRGYVEPAGVAEAVLVVDPVDGTRPALAGFESCCVSIAAAPLDGEPTIGDVTVGCVLEIPSGAVFLAERGAGILEGPPPRLSANERIDRMFWSYGFRGRPARPMIAVLGDLIDASSVGGASFELGSAAFDITRVVTGQLDAYIEPGPRLVEEVPGMRAQFERVGGGAVLNNSPYDLAAAALIADEAGAVVTDANGRSLRDRPLLGSGAEFQMSVVVSANGALQRRILELLDVGIRRVSG